MGQKAQRRLRKSIRRVKEPLGNIELILRLDSRYLGQEMCIQVYH